MTWKRERRSTATCTRDGGGETGEKPKVSQSVDKQKLRKARKSRRGPEELEQQRETREKAVVGRNRRRIRRGGAAGVRGKGGGRGLQRKSVCRSPTPLSVFSRTVMGEQLREAERGRVGGSSCWRERAALVQSSKTTERDGAAAQKHTVRLRPHLTTEGGCFTSCSQ